MSNSIGGNLETSIIMDASGVQQGADRGKAAMQDFAGSAARMGATLSGIGSETSALTSSLSAAASMVELLSAKLLANVSASRAATKGLREASTFGAQMGSTQPLFGDIMAGRRDVPGNRSAEISARESDLRDRVAQNMAQQRSRDVIEQIRQQEAARIQSEELVDRVARNLAARRASENIATIRAQQQRIVDSRSFRPNAGFENLLQPMEDSILRMRAELNPMVGMEARLAREATEFRQQMDLAVISGRITWQNAQRMTAEFQQQQALLLDQARASQAGFLGMRRMGFAAQQFGYAIEDAASVWGTMGMSGAFRAAGNNLTAMGAVLGPQVGVMASLAAAAVSLGISFYEAKKRAAELVEENKRLQELTENILDHMKYRVGIEQDLQSARSANHKELMEMYDDMLGKLQEINAEEEARIRTNQQLAGLTEQNNALKEIDRKISEDNAKWWREQFNWSISAWEYARDAALGVGNLFASEEGAKLAEERFNAETKITIEMNRQQALLDKANSAEQKRLDLINAQAAALGQRTRALFGDMAFGANAERGELGEGRIARRRLRQGEFDVRDRFSMGVRIPEAANLYNPKSTTMADNEDALAEATERMLFIRKDLVRSAQDETLSTEDRLRILNDIRTVETELLRVDEMRVKLNQEGKKSMELSNNTITGRYEALNEELGIENEILRTRQKMNEEIDISIRSGHVSQQQAQGLRNDMEDAFILEKDRRDNEKAIEELKKRESALESNARQDLTPGTTVAGLRRGSDEARAFLENERLRGMAQKDSEPTIAELRKVREEIKRLREANEKIGQSKPKTATIF